MGTNTLEGVSEGGLELTTGERVGGGPETGTFCTCCGPCPLLGGVCACWPWACTWSAVVCCVNLGRALCDGTDLGLGEGATEDVKGVLPLCWFRFDFVWVATPARLLVIIRSVSLSGSARRYWRWLLTLRRTYRRDLLPQIFSASTQENPRARTRTNASRIERHGNTFEERYEEPRLKAAVMVAKGRWQSFALVDAENVFEFLQLVKNCFLLVISFSTRLTKICEPLNLSWSVSRRADLVEMLAKNPDYCRITARGVFEIWTANSCPQFKLDKNLQHW